AYAPSWPPEHPQTRARSQRRVQSRAPDAAQSRSRDAAGPAGPPPCPFHTSHSLLVAIDSLFEAAWSLQSPVPLSRRPRRHLHRRFGRSGRRAFSHGLLGVEFKHVVDNAGTFAFSPRSSGELSQRRSERG